MKELYIYCAGGVGREVRAIAERKNARHDLWSAIRFVDDVVGSPDREIIRYVDFLALRRSSDIAEFLIGNGEPAYRETLRTKVYSDGYPLATLVDDTAIIAPSVVLRPGAILYPYVCVSPNSVIGENCLLYYHCSVAHDSVIGMDSLLSMSVNVSGHCHIGAKCFLGATSVVRENVTLGAESILGAGGILLCDAPAGGIYAGVPACRIGDNASKRVFS